ncbi:hypothetical protein [Nitrospirillum amazonense]|uniref:Uncharacterized protein n=1 Tax=Nitrospirillum amazonense TaxID=28077 RepID=A0A560JQZ0_9PROT|nr:hypothetical protein [Nitrospirillum amazonense]MDG3442083.1 hypothetical protein [Nitrospirillum amazonense]TWB73416.1 hypothetical protein FBZ87_105339 [Nitrospirillum amazonense]
MTTVTASRPATRRTATAGLMTRLTSLVEAAGMLAVAGAMALCINAML